MPWIPHLMILDDDPRVLGIARAGVRRRPRRRAGREQGRTRGDYSGATARSTRPVRSRARFRVKVSAHGFASDRVAATRPRGGRTTRTCTWSASVGGGFDLARKLLNEQLFAAVISDLRFSDDAGGLRAGQLFVDEAARVHPEVRGLLYSAYQ